MSLVQSERVAPSKFSLMPAEIGVFCILWSLAFIAGKIGVRDCPPLIFFWRRAFWPRVS